MHHRIDSDGKLQLTSEPERAPHLSQARISYEDEPRTLMGEMRKATEYSAANRSGEPNMLVIQ